MLDDTLPLTPGEWPEWGNPITDKAAFDLIRSYSPYDNVKAQAYPPLLITGGLNDPRVTYWEPAKWAAKLRATKTDDNLLLLKINMGAGHGGKSGRWEQLHEVAETYAFMLTQMRVTRPVFEMRHRAARAHRRARPRQQCGLGAVDPGGRGGPLGQRSPIPSIRTITIWVVVRHEIDYLRAAFEGERMTGADLGRRSPQGRAVRPAHGIRRRRTERSGSARAPMGDHRQGAGRPDPRSARGGCAVHGERV